MSVQIRGVSTNKVEVDSSNRLKTISTLSDSSSNPFASLDDGNGGKALEVAMSATNFVFSTVNATTTQLASGATFTGAVETIINQQTVCVLVTTDQTGTLVLNQYIDAAGVRLCNSWTYTVVAGVPFSKAFTINGNYFKLTFTNNGGSATTTLNINTAFGTLMPCTNFGNVPNSLEEIAGTRIVAGRSLHSASIPVTLPTAAMYGATSTAFTAANTATDIFTITGSATKTVRVTKICISGTQTTSSAVIFQLIKRSTANTAGTSSTLTGVPYDSTSAASTAVVRSYTANPTVGTLVGNIKSFRKTVPTTAITSDFEPIVLDFSSANSQPIVLRGVNDVLAVNLAGVTVTGNSFLVDVEWIEE